MKRPRAEWHGRLDFAEIAEALGVTTEAIMAAQNPKSDAVLVLYTPRLEEERVFVARLARGMDGILFRSTEDVEIPGMIEKLKADLEAHLLEELGPPEES